MYRLQNKTEQHGYNVAFVTNYDFVNQLKANNALPNEYQNEYIKDERLNNTIHVTYI